MLDKNSNPVGQNNLENREQWLKKTIGNLTKGNKILDAGAGELQYKKFCRHLDYTSQDFGQYDGKGDEAGLQTQTWDNSKLDIVSDITKIPVKAKSFDAVMCIEVLEHIPYPIDAIAEFARILKKDGYLIMTAPVSSLTHFAPFYFYNGYSRYFFEKVLGDNGLTILELDYNGNWFESLAQEIRRLPEITSKYSPDTQLNRRDIKAITRILDKLATASNTDKGSWELQSHGIHVLARKN